MKTSFVLLHGWPGGPRRFDAKWFISADFASRGVSVAMPVARGHFGWWPSDDEYIAEVIQTAKRRGRTIVGGFSDGARVALRAAHLEQVDGVVFHSGVWRDSDSPYLPASTLVIYGENDWTARVPFFGTNARAFATNYANNPDMTVYRHQNGHQWGPDTNRIIISWMKSLESLPYRA